MKAFLLKLIVFGLLCIGVDRGVGAILKYLNDHAKGGYTQRENFISGRVDTDILIFGSSRAAHHYVPAILWDSLQMSSFNCGSDGHGVIYAYGKLKTVLSRVSPKVVILDFISYLDLEKGDPVKDLAPLRPYYDYPGLDSLFRDIDATERWKMLSRCYPYNSQVLQLINDYRSNPVLSQDHGYLPLYGEMNYEPPKKPHVETPGIDPVKRKYLEAFIKEVKAHSKLIVFVSPTYGEADPGLYAVMKALCEAYQVPVFNHLNDSSITRHRNWFVDPVHLNDEGAGIYTKSIIGEIKRALAQE